MKRKQVMNIKYKVRRLIEVYLVGNSDLKLDHYCRSAILRRNDHTFFVIITLKSYNILGDLNYFNTTLMVSKRKTL